MADASYGSRHTGAARTDALQPDPAAALCSPPRVPPRWPRRYTDRSIRLPEPPEDRAAPRDFPKAFAGAPRPRPTRSRALPARTAAAPRSGTPSSREPGPDPRRLHRRCQRRPLQSIQGRCGADEIDGRPGLSLLDRLAARLSRRHGHRESQGLRFLRPAGRRTSRRRHRAVRNALSLGPAAGAAGSRRLGIARYRRAFGDYAAHVASRLTDRVRQVFTINEMQTFVEQGHETGNFAPGLKLPPGRLNQVRHHAVLAHGLAVQAVRASGRRGTKVGPAGKHCHGPACRGDGREHPGRRTGDARTERALPHGDDGGPLHRRLAREDRARRASFHGRRSEDHLKQGRLPRPERLCAQPVRAGERGGAGIHAGALPVVAPAHGLLLAPAGAGGAVLGTAPRRPAVAGEGHLHHRERRIGGR
jgi:hypothetical protein